MGPTARMGLIALVVLVFDQLTKLAVLRWLGPTDEKVVVEGFFRLVHWTNRGAAWSLFNEASRSNMWLGLFALVALVVLYVSRRHFDVHTLGGQFSLGLIFGGIIGNLTDRFFQGHVIDFLYFYLERRGGRELGFPAFNVADVAICTGVGLVFLMSWQKEEKEDAKVEKDEAGG
jgi:signal peptidase II